MFLRLNVSASVYKFRKRRGYTRGGMHICMLYGHANVSHNGHCFIRSGRDAGTGTKT